jgi:tetratricopeptide (TPR) repeat protein
MKKVIFAVIPLSFFFLFGCTYIFNRSYQDPYKHFVKGDLYFRNNKTKKAIKEFKKAINIDPRFALAYNNLGEVYSFLEKYEEAIREYKRALEINPELPEAHFNMVVSYILLKNYSLAWKHIDILNKLGEDTEILVHLLPKDTPIPAH